MQARGEHASSSASTRSACSYTEPHVQRVQQTARRFFQRPLGRSKAEFAFKSTIFASDLRESQRVRAQSRKRPRDKGQELRGAASSQQRQQSAVSCLAGLAFILSLSAAAASSSSKLKTENRATMETFAKFDTVDGGRLLGRRTDPRPR